MSLVSYKSAFSPFAPDSAPFKPITTPVPVSEEMVLRRNEKGKQLFTYTSEHEHYKALIAAQKLIRDVKPGQKILDLSALKLHKCPPLARLNKTDILCIKLHDNNLTEFPPELKDMEQLQVIDLSRNNITELSGVVGKCNNLTKLILNSNNLTDISEVTKAKSLIVLHAEKNNIQEIPPALKELRDLQSLNLGHNKITELPEEIGECQKLNTLVLNYNKLTTLPDSMGTMTNLLGLNLSDNKNLSELPQSVKELPHLFKVEIQETKICATECKNFGVNMSRLAGFIDKIRSVIECASAQKAMSLLSTIEFQKKDLDFLKLWLSSPDVKISTNREFLAKVGEVCQFLSEKFN